MSKKKLSKSQKEQRRLKEAAKAAGSIRGDRTEINAYVPATPTPKGDLKFTLPVSQIKKDLAKNAAYMLFVVIALTVLKITGISL